MKIEFKLPDIGEGVVEGEIVSWLVAEGDQVAEDQPVVEVLTDKATVTIPSPKAGRVVSLPWKVGDSVPVGKTLIVLEAGGDAPAAAPAAPKATAPVAPKASAPVAPTASAPKAQPAREPVAPASTPAPVPAPPPKVEAAPPPPQVEEVVDDGGDEASDTDDDAPFEPREDGRVLAAPATRRSARELGVDLAAVRPTGKFGRVTREDVERAAAKASAPAAAAPVAPAVAQTAVAQTAVAQTGVAQPGAGYVRPTPQAIPAVEGQERLKLKGIRKAQAEGMVRSFYTAPHFTYVEEIDVTELIAARGRLKGAAKDRGADLTYLPFIVKAVVAMLRQHKFVNASLDDAAQEIVFHKTFHIGIAVATEHGLTVPVLHDADKKGLVQIAQELADKSERARKLKLTKDDFGGSTFTITSLGRIGGILATPILNPGEVAILGIHNIRTTAKWDAAKQTFVPRETMNLSLSFDHRVVDGFTGATAVQTLRELLETPELLLLELR